MRPASEYLVKYELRNEGARVAVSPRLKVAFEPIGDSRVVSLSDIRGGDSIRDELVLVPPAEGASALRIQVESTTGGMDAVLIDLRSPDSGASGIGLRFVFWATGVAVSATMVLLLPWRALLNKARRINRSP